MGLTHRRDAEDPIYDGLNLFAGEDKTQEASDYFGKEGNHTLYEDHFTEKNKLWSGYLGEVLDRFSCPTTKVRLLNLKPRGILPSHVDCPHSEQIKVHAYITSNDNVWIDINGERLQIPCDGSFYWIDVGRWHSAWNDGNTDRIVLCVNLKVYIDHEGNQLIDPSNDILDVIEKGML